MSFSRQVRRQAHRVAKAPRSAWRRKYRYHAEGTLGHRIYTVNSGDAPIEEQDARFWDWVLASIVAVIVVGLLVWGIASIA